MIDLVRSEFRKLFTIKAPWISMGISIVVAAFLGYFVTNRRSEMWAHGGNRYSYDPSVIIPLARVRMTAYQEGLNSFMQFWRVAGLVAIVTMLAAETRDGVTRMSLLATPSRWKYMTAKVVVAVFYLVIGTAIALVTFASVMTLSASDAGVTLDLFNSALWSRYAGWFAFMALQAPIAVALGMFFRRGVGGATAIFAMVVIDALLATQQPIEWVIRYSPFAGGYTLVSSSQKALVNVPPTTSAAWVNWRPEYIGVGTGVTVLAVFSFGIWAISTWWFARRDV